MTVDRFDDIGLVNIFHDIRAKTIISSLLVPHSTEKYPHLVHYTYKLNLVNKKSIVTRT